MGYKCDLCGRVLSFCVDEVNLVWIKGDDGIVIERVIVLCGVCDLVAENYYEVKK